jgi:tRNA uridine 5-carboxymethylaminomethyl modification enzyme
VGGEYHLNSTFNLLLQNNQVVCYQTVTTPATHQIVRDNMHLSVHIQETKKGAFVSVPCRSSRYILLRNLPGGPRYCPSLEAKILRFNKQHHNVWLEPEGYDSGMDSITLINCCVLSLISSLDVIYPNGISCSIPEEVQEPMMRTIPGLENVKMVRPAYGVEYDHVDARELRRMFSSCLALLHA